MRENRMREDCRSWINVPRHIRRILDERELETDLNHLNHTMEAVETIPLKLQVFYRIDREFKLDHTRCRLLAGHIGAHHAPVGDPVTVDGPSLWIRWRDDHLPEVEEIPDCGGRYDPTQPDMDDGVCLLFENHDGPHLFGVDAPLPG